MRWFILIISILLCGCTPAKVDKGVLYTAGDWTLPPAYHGNPWSPGGVGVAANYVYEPLFSYIPATNEYLPRLGQSFQESPDGRTLTVKLRQGARWHDGQPFTSRDVETTFLIGYLKNLEIWAYLDSIECPDDQTVRFHWHKLSPTNRGQALTEPITSATHLFGQYREGVLDLQKRHPRGDQINEQALQAETKVREVLFSDRPAMPVGTGPFSLQRVTASDMVLRKFPGYYDAAQVHLEGVKIARWGRNEVIWAYLFAGQVDVISPALPDDVANEAMRRNPHLRRVTPSDGSEIGLLLNCRRGPLAEPVVRQALAAMLDRDLIRQLACAPADPPPVYSLGIVPSFASRWLDDKFMATLTPLRHDPALAQQLLEKAGWTHEHGQWRRDGQPVTLEILAPAGFTDLALVAEATAAQMTRFGFPSEVRLVPNDLFGSLLADGKFDMAATFGGQMGRYVHPSAPLGAFFYPGAPLQVASGLGEERESLNTRKLIEALRLEMNPAKTRALVAQLAGIQHRSLSFLPCYEKKLNIFVQDGPRVTGWPEASSPLWSAAPLSVENLYALLAARGLLKAAP